LLAELVEQARESIRFGHEGDIHFPFPFLPFYLFPYSLAANHLPLPLTPWVTKDHTSGL